MMERPTTWKIPRREALEPFLAHALGHQHKVFWCGQPARSVAGPGDLIGFAVLWCLLAGILTEMAISAQAAVGLTHTLANVLMQPLGRVDWLLAWGLWGTFMTLGVVARHKWNVHVARNTVYALVPRRAVILEAFPCRRATVIDLRHARGMTLVAGVADMGTLTFGSGLSFANVRHVQQVFDRAWQAHDTPVDGDDQPNNLRGIEM
ncbi:MAG: hypothetical protein JWM80_5267 [Cyanobacteria bacterium RYN_339]|nr:hypothetical protein [Cyanobacteria bacterium RYN_339]